MYLHKYWTWAEVANVLDYYIPVLLKPFKKFYGIGPIVDDSLIAWPGANPIINKFGSKFNHTFCKAGPFHIDPAKFLPIRNGLAYKKGLSNLRPKKFYSIQLSYKETLNIIYLYVL